MAPHLNDSYLSKLPVEMISNILSFLSSYEVILFFKAYPVLKYTILGTNTSKCINFTKQFHLNEQILSCIFDQNEPYRVTHLNINGVYWISAKNLQNCIRNLPLLKHLYVMGMQLRVSYEECLLYQKLKKLETLGITVDEKNFTRESVASFPDLKYIYFHSFCYANLQHLFDSIIEQSVNLKRLLLCYDVYPYSEFTLNYYNNKIQNFTKLKICYPHDGNLFFDDSTSWKSLLDELFGYNFQPNYFIPFGVNDIKNIRKNGYKLKRTFIEELSYQHDVYKPYSHELKVNLMKRSNFRYLKKLLLNFCIFHNYGVSKITDTSNDTTEILQNVLRNSNLLEELELWKCDAFDCKVTILSSALDVIPLWNNLKSLSLFNVPKEIRGDNLTEVFKKCNKLEFLQVKSPSNRKFFKNLCAAVSSVTSLKDFRYEDNFLSNINLILLAFCQVRMKNLRRICIKCVGHTGRFTVRVLERFLQKYLDLICFVCLIDSLTSEKIKKMQNLMNKYMDNKQKVYYIHKSEFKLEGSIPIIHKRDLVDYGTRIAVFKYLENDIFND